MTAIASLNLDLVVWEQQGRVYVNIQGPESGATAETPVPEDTSFFGISLALGAFMPHLGRMVDANIEIPDVTSRSFHLNGSSWHLPSYDNAEEFVRRLVREGILECDPLVTAVLDGKPPKASDRTIQRRFLTATGLTQGAIRQIDRARQAAVLIQEGVPARDVVHRLGYFDQPHLARSLTRYIGRTATQLATLHPPEPLSLLYKT